MIPSTSGLAAWIYRSLTNPLRGFGQKDRSSPRFRTFHLHNQPKLPRMNPTSATESSSTLTDQSPRASFCRRLVLDAFAPMQRGHLVIELPGGGRAEFGRTSPDATLPQGLASSAVIRVRREGFFRKCALAGDIGFGESYVDGDWDTPDLAAVVAWFIQNVETAPTLSGSRQRWRHTALNLLRFANRTGHALRPNSRTRARQNIREHYDLSNPFFALFLDPSMMYSAAKWTDPAFTLEQAQSAKNEALCQHLKLTSEDHVLEIGTGWGGWALHAVRTHDCRVTTVTLSQQQFEYARDRVAAAGLADRIEVRLCDYRDLTGAFDKIVSIEMMEAIGHRYLPDFCQQLHALLKPGGLLALQFITCPDHRYDELRGGVDFIQKHIFPGSQLLSLNRVNNLLSRAGGFVLHACDDFGPDYAMTLRHWRKAFHRQIGRVRALGFDERFIRKWDYYLQYCEAAFALRNISVVHTVHTRANNVAI